MPDAQFHRSVIEVAPDTGAAVSPDYVPSDNAFNGRVRGVQIAIAEVAAAETHVVLPEEALRVAMARQ